MMLPVTEFAPAKLNLYLHITGKREDGYHLLDSLVVFTEFGDHLQFYPSDALSLEMEGEFAGSLQEEQENIVLKAATLLKTHTGCRQGARILLHKNIPVSAGLGGGSSDAAATLRGLLRLWNLPVTHEDQQLLAGRLGSDVPICLGMRPALMRGAGEDIAPVECHSDAWAVMVNPRISLATADVYRRFSGSFDSMMDIPFNLSFEAFLGMLNTRHNALEAAALSLCPAIGDVLEALRAMPGCRLARMAGSGATCFGLFEHGQAAKQVAHHLKATSTWWAAATPFRQKNALSAA